MQPRRSFDRTLVIPIAIGIFSILGIGWLIWTKDLGDSLKETFIPPTAMPSSSGPLEAATWTPFPSPVPTLAEMSPTVTTTGPDSYPGPFAEILPTTSALVTETPPTPSTTPTPAGIQPLRAGKYDDTDPNIAYDPHWIALKNTSTAKSYEGTIHASFDAGSEASFRFTGKGFRLGYKRGKNFGTVTVMIDGQPYSFYEQAFDLVWRSPQLSAGDHFVRIIHQSGESINLDYILILE